MPLLRLSALVNVLAVGNNWILKSLPAAQVVVNETEVCVIVLTPPGVRVTVGIPAVTQTCESGLLPGEKPRMRKMPRILPRWPWELPPAN